MFKRLIILVFFGLCVSVYSQKVESILVQDSARAAHSPHKATMLALVPGLGQAYNKKYWKMPIIYAAMGGLGYSVYFNNKSSKSYIKSLVYRKDNKITTDPFNPNLTKEQLQANRDYYLGNRDLSIIVLVVVYGLQIVDAAVDAHLYKFNVNRSLSVNLFEPVPNTVSSVSLVFKF